MILTALRMTGEHLYIAGCAIQCITDPPSTFQA